MNLKSLAKAAVVAAGVALAPVSHADTVTFSSWLHNGGAGDAANYTVTIDDAATPGKFTFTLDATDNPLDPNVDVLGFFFRHTGPQLGASNITGALITSKCFDYDSPFLNECGTNANNLNGTGQTFNVGLQIGRQGGGGGAIDFATFTVDALAGLTLDSFTLLGIRAQSTDTNGRGSDKAWTSQPDPETPVPLPGSLALIGIAAVGLAAAARRRAA